jgi:hypothetical protein
MSSMPPMVDPKYLHGVEQGYQGEVYGEVLYRAIAAAQTDPEHARKWRVLVDLEIVTKANMRTLVARLGGDVTEQPYWLDRAHDDIPKYTRLDWRGLMLQFQDELGKVIEEYAALETDCPPEDAAALRLLTEHEEVTKEFVERELAGRTADSLDPVHDYLFRARQMASTLS